MNILFDILKEKGYKIVGTVIKERAIVYDVINSADEMPIGWTACFHNAPRQLTTTAPHCRHLLRVSMGQVCRFQALTIGSVTTAVMLIEWLLDTLHELMSVPGVMLVICMGVSRALCGLP